MMGRKNRNYCNNCGEEIVDRHYPTAQFCRPCWEDYRAEYLRDWNRSRYMLQKLITYTVPVVLIEHMEVDTDADRIAVRIQ